MKPITPNRPEIIQTYIKIVTTESRNCMRLIDGAKTNTKKQYFLKKLKENNQLLAKLLELQAQHTSPKSHTTSSNEVLPAVVE